jgi:hypothetical protein
VKPGHGLRTLQNKVLRKTVYTEAIKHGKLYVESVAVFAPHVINVVRAFISRRVDRMDMQHAREK